MRSARPQATALLALLYLSSIGLHCASTPRASRETAPNALRGEAPHIEIKVDRPLIRPGQRVYVKAYGRGELRDGWSCTYQLWRTDETGWKATGTQPKTQCADEVESWIWPDGRGREYQFFAPGPHEVCVQVYQRHGYLVGRQMCARVDVVGGNQ